MPLKDILVHLDPGAAGEARLHLAAGLARRHDAHLIGLHVVDVVYPSMALAHPGGSAALLANLYEQMRHDALEAAEPVEAVFRACLHREALSGEWRCVEGACAGLVTLHARYADLAILGQHDPDVPRSGSSLIVEQALFGSGGPVLVVPYAWRPASLGQRVLIGWDAGREAARALRDALPLLAGAERATVLVVNPEDGDLGEAPGDDIALHLARHGMTVEVERVTAADIAVADILLNRAADLSADLLVVGAYGHTRLRELVLGGVTRTLLRTMTVPVLMAH